MHLIENRHIIFPRQYVTKKIFYESVAEKFQKNRAFKITINFLHIHSENLIYKSQICLFQSWKFKRVMRNLNCDFYMRFSLCMCDKIMVILNERFFWNFQRQNHWIFFWWHIFIRNRNIPYLRRIGNFQPWNRPKRNSKL